MAADGTPEPALRRCGAAIARLRTLRGWSRAKLIARLYDQIDPTNPLYDRISIAWLARLEGGRVVKLSRLTSTHNRLFLAAVESGWMFVQHRRQHHEMGTRLE